MMCKSVVMGHLGAFLKSIKLRSHVSHSASQTRERFRAMVHLLTREQLLKLAQPLLVINLLIGQKLLEVQESSIISSVAVLTSIVEAADRVDLAWRQVGHVIWGVRGKVIRAAGSSLEAIGSSLGGRYGMESDVFSGGLSQVEVRQSPLWVTVLGRCTMLLICRQNNICCIRYDIHIHIEDMYYTGL